MSDINNERIQRAKDRLKEAVPDAIDEMIELAKEAKAEPVKLQAIKAILEQNDAYVKAETEAEAAEMERFIDEQIVFLLKEVMRKNVFLDMKNSLVGEVDPRDIVRLREQTDLVFGVGEVPLGELESGDEDHGGTSEQQ